jgi:ectoine hydroxylase-related dioxygenase (phytanoyl-CoA dioxygenase family)
VRLAAAQIVVVASALVTPNENSVKLVKLYRMIQLSRAICQLLEPQSPDTMNSFFDSTDVNVAAFAKVCEQTTLAADYPRAASVADNLVIYDADRFRSDSDPGLKSELAGCLRDGPGVFVVRAAFDNRSMLDRCSEWFARIVDREATQGEQRGDHFGNNERIWNSLQKTCLADPELFVEYYSNPILHLASEAWLGPGYRITAQMNNIKPGGSAQTAHRDYHLGFQSAGTIAKFPLHAQVMSQYLTLQGAIAHTNMPIESGPTLLLPFSHQYPMGYLATGNPEFTEYFLRHHVQFPLSKGDALFFNPALFHAGGSNSSKSDRVANLIQVSSPFGRTMESLDHRAMIEVVYPLLLNLDLADLTARQRAHRVIAVIADGYSFPTNLDVDPPVDGNAPESQQQLVRRSLDQSLTPQRLSERLDENDSRRNA